MLGLNRGDVAGIWSCNSYSWMPIVYACSKLGIVLCPINQAYKYQELANVLKLAQIKLLFMPGLNSSQDHDDDDPIILQHIISICGQDNILDISSAQVSPEDPAFILFTSGTTGKPKAACLSQFSFVITNCMHSNSQLVNTLTRYKCTDMFATPVMVSDMLSYLEINRVCLPDLYGITMVGSPVSNELATRIPLVLPRCTGARVCYSITETSELLTRGFSQMLYYWRDEIKTKEVIDNNGWYITGDMAVMDEHGYLKICGRINDMIIVGGENVYPQEVEDVLRKHYMVNDAYVIGVPDNKKGEEICAWIRLNQLDHMPKENALRLFCEHRMAKYKVPSIIDWKSAKYSYAYGNSDHGLKYLRATDVLDRITLSSLKRGDVVGMWCGNAYSWIPLFYACGKLGIILCAIHPTYKSQELDHGTTGKSKGACLSQFTMAPFYHVLGMDGIMGICAHPTTLVVPSCRYSTSNMVASMIKHKCTDMWAIPTMLSDMLSNVQSKQINLVHLRSGGFTISNFNDTNEHRLGTIGRPVENLEARIVDSNTGNIVKVGVAGEIQARGHSRMIGYWREPEMTKAAFDERNWYKTGDMGTMDEHGYIKIAGRIKDMIIVGGENVYPQELENLLREHHDVLDAYVVGVPDKRKGEAICAWIQLKHHDMAPYKVPRC
ncbi:unnamed protein product [Medioppia subpectinata]|uniref:Medium-chain acyl-CoA ligase ACSF2, mitochondrial n=1 Tax=Medioppia subpectinata TaxID=1979941 RepID=A0A7R9PVL1_9ACAR|nr:unnamed protein product [Medioppia subpectinata]CAG2102961.1 unnamed protein product [Medioppia subpectinata]